MAPFFSSAEDDAWQDAVGIWPKDSPIVTLCNCSEDAGSAIADTGYMPVKPLQEGYEAWLETVKQ